jgi:hypothetical protein
MVRSRSETNLNKIFLDLCTSPDVRSKQVHPKSHQRVYNPPLLTLQAIKSISQPDLTKNSQNEPQSSILVNTEAEILDLTTPLPLPPLVRHEPPTTAALTITPLIPMASTGFTVQTTTFINSASISEQEFSSFETQSFPLRNTYHHHEKKSNDVSLITKTSSGDKKQQDYTCRLRDRLKSRRHLRKFFLS